jgi:hypothetical protein
MPLHAAAQWRMRGARVARGCASLAPVLSPLQLEPVVCADVGVGARARARVQGCGCAAYGFRNFSCARLGVWHGHAMQGNINVFFLVYALMLLVPCTGLTEWSFEMPVFPAFPCISAGIPVYALPIFFASHAYPSLPPRPSTASSSGFKLKFRFQPSLGRS